MSRKDLKSTINIISKNEDWIAVVKPPQCHSDEITLESGASGEFKAVHRLDFETQGILILAAERYWASFNELFLSKTAVKKFYLAGCPDPSLVNGPVQGWIGSRYRSSKKTRFVFEEKELRGFRTIQDAEHILQVHFCCSCV